MQKLATENDIGTVVGSTSPLEYNFHLKRFTAKLGDLVTVKVEVPAEKFKEKKEVIVWGRITALQRFNPFLPAEATMELAEEGLDLTDTVLSNTRDQIEGTVLILGCTSEHNFKQLLPLNYPVQPGSIVKLPTAESIKKILIGDDEDTKRMKIGTLIGRTDIDVSLKTNVVIARHMAILAMTGGGKTVASRRVIRELLDVQYPILILDPHGDYLGLWEQRDSFKNNQIKIFYPSIHVTDQNRDLISFLVSQMTQGFTDPQKEEFNKAMEGVKIDKDRIDIIDFLNKLLSQIGNWEPGRGHKGTIPAVKRGLRMVLDRMEAMKASNGNLRKQFKDFDFQPLPDPQAEPEKLVSPGQASIVFLGGYDHLTQSSIVSILLKHLFDHRASMGNRIPPFLTVIEEAHNFIPSRGEGQYETPSVEIIRKIITEGRKFGVGLILVSQRPSRLDETTLSQCNTFMVFRLVNPRDQAFVEKVMENLSKADSKLLPGFGPGEGIVSGQAVRFPLVVRIKFDDDLKSSSIGDEDFISIAQNWTASEQATAVKNSAEYEEALKSASNPSKK